VLGALLAQGQPPKRLNKKKKKKKEEEEEEEEEKEKESKRRASLGQCSTRKGGLLEMNGCIAIVLHGMLNRPRPIIAHSPFIPQA
jgi:hypothetical protein